LNPKRPGQSEKALLRVSCGTTIRQICVLVEEPNLAILRPGRGVISTIPNTIF
jgi:hypothetical protein